MFSFLRPASSRRLPLPSRPALVALECRAVPDAKSYVSGLYAGLLGRAASDGEARSWAGILDAGARGEDVARGIAGSAEYRGRVVDDAYRRLLGRAADDNGRHFWVEGLGNGLTPDRLEVQLIASDEYFGKHGGTDDGYLDGLYHDMLGRAADAGGLAFWREHLHSGRGRELPAETFANGHERHTHEVEDRYREVLHRSPDDGGRAFWAGTLDNGLSGTDLTVKLSGSREHGHEFEFETEPEDRGGGRH